MESLINFQYDEFSLELNPPTPGQKSTLLIIDNEGQFEYFTNLMQSCYELVFASNNQQGFDLATQLLPDLILTDLFIPEHEDKSLCHRLKQHNKTSHIPVIVLASHDDLYCRIKSFYLGADDYMASPLQSIELRIRIENLIQSRRILQKKYSRKIELKPAGIEIHSKDELFLKQVMQVIEANMDNALFGSEQFARQTGLSQTRLYRKMVSLTGYSPNDFLRRIRLQRAADLLNKQAGNVSEVAYRVGFNSMSYFAKCFKEFHQYTPREYARRSVVSA